MLQAIQLGSLALRAPACYMGQAEARRGAGRRAGGGAVVTPDEGQGAGSPITRGGGLDRFAPALVWLAAFAVFARTAYPTITWWDSGALSLAAVTLGVSYPPGSLLLTLLGWVVTRLPVGFSQAHLLNLVAGAMAATTVTLVFVLAVRLLGEERGDHAPGRGARSGAALAGAALGALTLAFGSTLWQYATQFTPYVLTSVFTGLILWTLLRWWRSADDRGAWRWLLLLGLLFGLDYSVHRTNALLMPGALVWVLVRRPRTLRTARAWLAGAGGLLAGLAFQLLIIPIAAAHPSFNLQDPGTWSRFYDYESLSQIGGAPFLVQFSPRHAALWSVQAMDFLRSFGANFLWLRGAGGVLGILPALLGVVGWLALWRRERRLALAFAALLVLHAVFTVGYFNIPAHFMRNFDRHYLPVFVTWGVLVACGAGEFVAWAGELGRPGRWRALAWSGALVAVVPLGQLAHNWRADDAARRTFARDFAANLLEGLPPRAILFTAGDNDTWPPMYVQTVEHVRPDVRIVNLSLANAGWYVRQIVREDPAFPLPRGWVVPEGVREWRDTSIVLPVSGSPAEFGLPDSLALPGSITVDVAPTIAGKYVTPADLLLLEVLEANRWRRPLCFATTMGKPGWDGLAPYARLDGLFWRVVPYANPPASVANLRANLLRTYRYRGYADSGVLLDLESRRLGASYYPPLVALARAEAARGEAGECRQTRDEVLRALPLARLEPDTGLRGEIQAACARAGKGKP